MRQFYGLKSKVMFTVPKNVKNEALYAFKLKKIGFKGGQETGWKRARQLAFSRKIPIEDVKYMKAWFARHVYASYPSYKKWVAAKKPLNDKYWHNKRGIISWLIWGGNSGYKWANKLIK